MSALKVVKPATELVFTGERFVPGAGVEIAYDHWARYAFAAQFAKGRRVLDVASGEGYGAAFMAETAQSVVGFDQDQTSIRHARERYGGRANLTFAVASLGEFLANAEARSYDLVTAFEIIEHVSGTEQAKLLDGLSRVLARGGIAVLSTPDRHTYSDSRATTNPFHVRELYRSEFEALIARHFQHSLFLDQTSFTGSAILGKGQSSASAHQLHWTDLIQLHAELKTSIDFSGRYVVGLASHEPLPRDISGHVLLDPSKKLVAEEKHDLEERVRMLQAAAQTDSASREPVSPEQCAAASALSTTVDVLASRIAAAVNLQTERHEQNLHLRAIMKQLHEERTGRAHLENMLSVKFALIVKGQFDRRPRLKEVTRRILMRLV